MIVYLAGFKTIEKIWNKPTNDIYLLSSFWEHKNDKFGKYVTQEKHILDSGAFSMLKGKTNIDFNKYTEEYIEFIKKTNQKLFFELDIYKIIGTKKTEELRKKIENETNKQSIPVWHKHLGLDYLIKLSNKYEYIAFGGFAIKDITSKDFKYIPYLLNICKKNNCKVHGLGFTQGSYLKTKKFNFYSIDSTTWNVGGKFGNVCVFDKDGFLTKRYKTDKNHKAKTNELNLYNFEQWVKFQKWAINNI
jgi:hypothetical protein